MKAWIVWGTILAGFLLGRGMPARAQAQAGRQVAAQATAARQAPAPPAQPAAAPAPSPAASAPQQASPPPSGSRDPFRAIVIKRAEILPPSCKEPGKRSLIVGQLQLQGIARNVEGQWIAVVDNKTKRAYFMREKDELCNGVVTRITEDSLVLEEQSMDSFGRTRTREVVLRPADQ